MGSGRSMESDRPYMLAAISQPQKELGPSANTPEREGAVSEVSEVSGSLLSLQTEGRSEIIGDDNEFSLTSLTTPTNHCSVVIQSLGRGVCCRAAYSV